MASKAINIRPTDPPPATSSEPKQEQEKPPTPPAPPVPTSPGKTETKTPVGIQGVKPGPIGGGQQVPIVVGSQKGPRLRGTDVHDVNARAAALEWYFVFEDVPQPSRFATHGVCRECAWGCYSILDKDSKLEGSASDQLSRHVQHAHLYA